MRDDGAKQEMALVWASSRCGARNSGLVDHRRDGDQVVLSGGGNSPGAIVRWLDLGESSDRCTGRTMVSASRERVLMALRVARVGLATVAIVIAVIMFLSWLSS